MPINYEKILDKIALPLGIVLTISLLVGAYFIIKYSNSATSAATGNHEPLVVEVAGAVASPGVYNFTNEQIVEDAIKVAGGLTEQADMDLLAKTVNRAALLQDHGKIYIPIKGAAGTTLDNLAIGGVASTATLVNINTATLNELDTLPGIGPVTAKYIIDYRTAKGPFKRKEDLMKVSGISSSKYAKLKDLVTL